MNGQTQRQSRPGSAERANWAGIAIIGLVLLLNHTDRLILGILVEPIRAEFGLSDGELGLLTGPAFSIVYALFVLPIARLAERHSRIAIVSVCVLIWSGATAACGLASGFIALIIARMAVGLGEAGGIAPSMSLVCDLAPARVRATAMSVFGLGASAGVLLAPLIGGAFVSEIGWRGSFLIMGALGAPIALLLFLAVREPNRGLADGLKHAAGQTRWTSALGKLLHRPSYVLLVVSFVLITLAQFSLLAWLPAFFQRSHGLGAAELGVKLSFYQGLPLLLGNLLGGALSDRLARYDERRMLWLPMLASFVSAAVMLAVFTSESPELAFALLALPSFAQGLSLGPSYALLQNLAAVHSRATSTAFLAMAVTLLGAGLGPLLLGLFSQFLSHVYGAQSLRYAFLAISPFYALSGLLFFLMRFSLSRDLGDARADSTPHQSEKRSHPISPQQS